MTFTRLLKRWSNGCALALAEWIARRHHCCVVPAEPTKAMLYAACKAMSPGARPTSEWVPNKAKHAIRYRAMVKAARVKVTP